MDPDGSPGTGSPVDLSNSLTFSREISLLIDFIKPIAPATIGEAMLVPSIIFSLLPGIILLIFSPGAKIVTLSPKLEKEVRAKLLFTAATLIALSERNIGSRPTKIF